MVACVGELDIYLIVYVHVSRDACLCVSRKNPLGMGGDMAKRYGDLVCELWKGTSKSIVPLRFRVSVSVRTVYSSV